MSEGQVLKRLWHAKWEVTKGLSKAYYSNMTLEFYKSEYACVIEPNLDLM